METNRANIVALFNERSLAQAAVRELRDAGFREDQIGIIGHDTVGEVAIKRRGEDQTKWDEGAIAGGLTGAGIGGLWALGIAVGLMPAVGPVVVGGLLASVFASAAGGAAAGSVLGALIGLGVPEAEARYYEGQFKAGRHLVTVRPEGRDVEVAGILRRNGGDIRSDELSATVAGGSRSA